MQAKVKTFDFAKLALTSALALTAGLSMMFGSVKPASADSSFSFSISTDNFHIGYRNYDGGGYRYWTPGSYDRYHRWRDGYYSGPVVYGPSDARRHDYHDSYDGGSQYRTAPGYRTNGGDGYDQHSYGGGDRQYGYGQSGGDRGNYSGSGRDFNGGAGYGGGYSGGSQRSYNGGDRSSSHDGSNWGGGSDSSSQGSGSGYSNRSNGSGSQSYSGNGYGSGRNDSNSNNGQR